MEDENKKFIENLIKYHQGFLNNLRMNILIAIFYMGFLILFSLLINNWILDLILAVIVLFVGVFYGFWYKRKQGMKSKKLIDSIRFALSEANVK